jgi:RNA polymerase sigma-70 factor (ECF subfamily)
MSMSTDSDTELMQRVRDGDTAAFKLLYDRYREKVRNFFFHLTWDAEVAKDWTQEVFLRLWLARARYEPTGKFTTYLFQIAKNFYLNHRARQKQDAQTLSLDEVAESGALPKIELIDLATQPDVMLFHKYRQRQIRRAIAALPEPYRLVFTMSHFDGLKYREIADVLSIPVGTVKSRMNGAVRMLRQMLTEKDI